MQPPDLLSLFQRAPSQPTTATNMTDAERSSLQSPTHDSGAEGSKDIESLFRNLAPTDLAAPLQPLESPASVPLPVLSPPESVVSNSTVTSNPAADRQTALLSLFGPVAVLPKPQQPAPSQSIQQQPQLNASQAQSFLQQLVGSEPQAPHMTASHSVPPPASHQQPMASALPPHLSDREAQVEMQRKSLFDFVSPYDALQSGQSQSQLYIGPPVSYQPQVAHASHSAGPSAAKKKPVPVYNPSPAPGSQNPSPQISPKQMHIPQRRHTPSPEPSQYVNAYSQPQPPQQQQHQQQQDEQYAESLHSEPMPPQALPPTGIDSSSEVRSVPLPQSYPSSGGVSQHGPLPPIPQGRSSPVAPPLAQRPNIPQQVQQPLPSPPMRNQQVVYDSQQYQPQPLQQQPQQPRGRGSPASSRQGTGPSPSTNRDGAGSPAGSGRGTVQDINKKAAANKTSSPYSTQTGQLKNGRQQQYSPSVHSLITIDVTSPLTSTMAAQDIASITPIALLKLEPTYTRGTTIGVANFIAYAMSRGRIRLIGRQTGERALLKLPATFPGNAQVQDMVISGTKLACVSTDGGVVVWDIPEDIEDDAASVSRIILHVPPHPDVPGFKVVKWHPKQAGVLAIASEKEIYLLNIEDSQQTFGSDGVSQAELSRVSTVFQVSSPLVSFTFDVPQVALASISIDSTVTLWSIRDKMPYWSGRVQGEGAPSSIDFLDGGLVVGRNQGNVIQLLPVQSTNVLSTIKFVLGKPLGDNQDLMFGHFCYDPASKILWVASSARPSLFAVKIGADAFADNIRPTFDQIVEFSCSAPAINLTVVPAESVEENSNWTRDASLVVSAFCVHSGGVDQININQDAYDEAAMRAEAKLPSVSFGGTPSGSEREGGRRQSAQSQNSNTGLPTQAPTYMMQQPPRQPDFPQQSYAAPQQQQIPNTLPSYANMQQRPRSPLSQEPITQSMYDPQPPAQVPVPAKAGKPKDAGPATAAAKQSWKASPGTSAVDPGSSSKSDTEALAANLTKEMRRVEDSLHNKVSRLIIKELDKQQVRLEEVRHADQTADFERQEKILKLISTELTRNTTRVVESAVKNVIQNSVLPALENVTRSEVKVALNAQIAKGLAESMKQTLPVEIEKLLLRPDVSNHVARTFSAAITPVVERNVIDTIHNTLIPAYSQVNNTMHQELSREIRSEILNLKKEVVTWQSDALKGTEVLVREMEQSIRSLAEQVKILSAQVASSAADATHRAKVQQATPDYTQQLRQPAAAPAPVNPSAFLQPYNSSSGWVNSAQPQPIQSSQPPFNLPPLQPTSIPSGQPVVPQNRPEDWDETFLSTLGMHDQKKLRDLLVRASPDAVIPADKPSPLSQTVILALIHRLALSSTELSPADDAFKTSLYWLQRSVFALDPEDTIIAPYINRVLQTAVGTLNTTTQRMNVLPGGPSTAEASNMINTIQQRLTSLMT